MFAGTNHGVFYLTSLNGEWEPATMIHGAMPEPETKPTTTTKTITTKSGKKVTRTVTQPAAKKAVAEKSIPIAQAPRILAFNLDGDKWFAATNDGVFVFQRQGPQVVRRDGSGQ